MISRLLVIDDDHELCELLQDYLGAEGFVVEAAHDGEAGAARALSGDFDLVILDVMLPGMNGFEVLRKVRTSSMVPILMLTARGEEVDRIVGLEMGADDYLPKPFNARELVARIRAVQRRAGAGGAGEQDGEVGEARVAVGDLDLDPGSRRLIRGGVEVELTAVEFDLLRQLMKRAGRAVPREELAKLVLGRELEVFDRSIDVHVSSLRRKLGLQPGGRERIVAVRGVGYQLLASAV